MAHKESLSREDVLRVAELAGIDAGPSHMDDLHAYLKGLFPILETLKDLDLSELEPFMPSLTKKE